MNCRRIIGSVVLAAALLVPQCVYGAKVPTLYYEAKLSAKQGDMGTRKTYIKGAYYYTETKVGNMTFRTVKNKDGAFMIHPMDRYAAKYPSGTNRDNPIVFLPGPTGDVKAFLAKMKAKKTGSEKIGDKPCDIYTYHEPVTELDCKLWVETKSSSPVKLVYVGKDKQTEITATYASFKLGLDVPDSKFELPKDIKIVQMKEPEKKDAPKAAKK